MKNLRRKLSALAVTALFASMQVSYAVIDTGLGGGNGGALCGEKLPEQQSGKGSGGNDRNIFFLLHRRRHLWFLQIIDRLQFRENHMQDPDCDRPGPGQSGAGGCPRLLERACLLPIHGDFLHKSGGDHRRIDILNLQATRA